MSRVTAVVVVPVPSLRARRSSVAERGGDNAARGESWRRRLDDAMRGEHSAERSSSRRRSSVASPTDNGHVPMQSMEVKNAEPPRRETAAERVNGKGAPVHGRSPPSKATADQSADAADAAGALAVAGTEASPTVSGEALRTGDAPVETTHGETVDATAMMAPAPTEPKTTEAAASAELDDAALPVQAARLSTDGRAPSEDFPSERERAADEPRVEPSLRVDVSALERNSAPMSRSSAHAAPTSFDALRDEASSVTPPSPWLASTHRASLVVGEGDERVSLAVETSGANVRIEARTANAGLAEALEHGIPVLRAALEEHGVHLAQLHARSDGDRQHGSAAREDPRALRGPRIVARSPTPVEAATPCTLEQARTRMTRIIA